MKLLFAVLCLSMLLLGVSASEEPALSPETLHKITKCVKRLFPDVDAEKVLTKFEDLPNELLLEIIERLGYDDWLALYNIKNNQRLHSVVLSAAVSKMDILPAHINEPIPPAVTSVCASVQKTGHDTRLVISRLEEVLEKKKRIRSISLDRLPIEPRLFGLICSHEESLKRLSIRLDGLPYVLQRGWIRRFKNLRKFEIHAFRMPNIVFPEDFGSLTRLVYLSFAIPDFPLPDNAFQYLSGLRYLKIHVRPYSIPGNVFKPLVNLNVLELDYGSSSVPHFGSIRMALSFDSETFKGLVDLRGLVFTGFGDRPIHIGTGAFSHLERLTSVKLDQSPDPTLVFDLRQELEPLGFILHKGYEFIRPELATQ